MIRMALRTVAFLMLVSPILAYAQDVSGGPDNEVTSAVRKAHTIHVAPHLVVLTPAVRTAALTLSNTGATPIEGDVLIQLGYTYWQSTDTVLFSRHWATEAPTADPRDTVIMTPGPQDHYAGRWLSGIPAHLRLAPHETKRVTLRITPPKDLPNGEYYARIVTIAHVPHGGDKSQDTRQRYALPVSAKHFLVLRDSVRVFYRQGPQAMRLQLTGAAQLDTTQEGLDSAAAVNVGTRPLRHLVHVHLIGPTHFEGYERDFFLTPSGERIALFDDRARTSVAYTIQHDAVMRDLDETDELRPGHYTLLIQLVPQQDEFPPSQRVPADTATVAIPFDIPK